MDFTHSTIRDELLKAFVEQLETATSGVVALDHAHRVVSWNATEVALSGLSAARVIGRHFFTEVAPGTNNFMVAQRFESEPSLDATIDYVFTLAMRPTAVKLRMLRRRGADRQCLLVQRTTRE